MQSGSDKQDCHRIGGADPHIRQSPVAAAQRPTNRLARQSAARLRSPAHHLAHAAKHAVERKERPSTSPASGRRRRSWLRSMDEIRLVWMDGLFPQVKASLFQRKSFLRRILFSFRTHCHTAIIVVTFDFVLLACHFKTNSFS